jgi:chaperone modulatory protein CbpM
MYPHHPGDTAEFAAVVIVEQQLSLSGAELSTACGCDIGFIEELVAEGALVPDEVGEAGWRFSGVALARTSTAARLARDLGINVPGVAFALDLLDEIASLRERLAG